MITITDITKALIIVGGIASAIIILKRDRAYLGNQLMASAMLLFATYAFGIFLYDFIGTNWGVQTFLRILLKNKAVAHDVNKRTFVYYPLIESTTVKFKAVRDFIDNLFTGSPEGVISYIIKNMDVTPDQLSEIKKLIDDKEK